MPYFGQLYSSRLKDVGRTEVYVHTSRLREKILAAGFDLVWTHHSRGKELVLVFNKDTGEGLNIACKNLICFNCSDVESVLREIKQKINGGSVPPILKTLISFILTGTYATTQSKAKQLSYNKAALLISQSIAFHSTKLPSLQRHKRDKKLPFPFLWA